MNIPKKPSKDASAKEKKEWQEYLSNETKQQRTKRVIEPRVNRVIKQIVKLKKTATSPRYDYDAETVDKIEDALTSIVNEYISSLRNEHDEESFGIEF